MQNIVLLQRRLISHSWKIIRENLFLANYRKQRNRNDLMLDFTQQSNPLYHQLPQANYQSAGQIIVYGYVLQTFRKQLQRIIFRSDLFATKYLEKNSLSQTKIVIAPEMICQHLVQSQQCKQIFRDLLDLQTIICVQMINQMRMNSKKNKIKYELIRTQIETTKTYQISNKNDPDNVVKGSKGNTKRRITPITDTKILLVGQGSKHHQIQLQ